MAQMLRFRVVGSLPANVVGPKTRWVLLYELSGKGGKYAAVVARCLTNANRVVLIEGRENYVANAVRAGGITAAPSTIQGKLLLAMVTQGHAEIV